MKAKGLKIFLMALGSVIVTLGILAVVGIAGGTAGMGEVRAYKLPDVDMAKVADGSYDGECTIGRFATTVTVAVKDHRVTMITLSKKDHANIGTALVGGLSEKIIGKDKPEFDAVSGASITSKAFFIAVADALKKGMK